MAAGDGRTWGRGQVTQALLGVSRTSHNFGSSMMWRKRAWVLASQYWVGILSPHNVSQPRLALAQQS